MSTDPFIKWLFVATCGLCVFHLLIALYHWIENRRFACNVHSTLSQIDLGTFEEPDEKRLISWLDARIDGLYCARAGNEARAITLSLCFPQLATLVLLVSFLETGSWKTIAFVIGLACFVSIISALVQEIERSNLRFLNQLRTG